MSRDRGIRLQAALAAYLRRWWPSAESTPNGRGGTDILGTPGVAWECKTAKDFSPAAFVRQAKAHRLLDDGEVLPVAVYFPPGFGARSTGDVLAILALDDLMGLLTETGHAPYPKTRATCRCGQAIVRCDGQPSHAGCGSARGWIHEKEHQHLSYVTGMHYAQPEVTG